jgi:hypothetical protein
VVLKNPLGLPEGSRYNSFFKAETMGVVIEIEGGSVNRCFKTPVMIADTGYNTEKGYLENWAAGKSRLSSYIFPRAVEIGRRLFPIFPHLAFRETFPTWKRLFTEPPSLCKIAGECKPILSH